MIVFRNSKIPSTRVDPPPHSMKCAALPAVCSVADRLFASIAKLEPAPQVLPCAAPVFLVDDGNQSLAGAIDRTTWQLDSLDQVACVLACDPACDQTLVVNLDTFADADEAVSALMNFRREWPQIAIVIASQKFKRDDLSPERRVIADASVKLPTTTARLALAISVARRHNTVEQRVG